MFLRERGKRKAIIIGDNYILYVCSTVATSMMILSSSALHGAVKISGSRILRHLAILQCRCLNYESMFT